MSSSPAAPSPTPGTGSSIDTSDRRRRRLQLCRAWRVGDERAGQVLFRELRAELVARLRGCPPHLVDDLVQDTLVACLLARDTLRHDAALSSYARCVARRVLLHHCHHVRAVRPLDHEVGRDERNVARVDAAIDAQRLLSACSSSHAVVIALRYLEEHRGVAVARLLRISEASVRRRLRCGLDEVRRSAGLTAS